MDGERGGSRGEGRKAGVIKVKLFATLRLSLGVSSVDIEVNGPKTVEEVLRICSEKLGRNISEKLLEEPGKLLQGSMILVNGKNILHEEDLNTKVFPGDVISLFPPLSGG